MGCRQVAEQADLVRIARTPEGALVVSRTHPGRGAWLCAGSPACLDQALRRNAFSRAFRVPVTRAAAEALRTQL